MGGQKDGDMAVDEGKVDGVLPAWRSVERILSERPMGAGQVRYVDVAWRQHLTAVT